ncbi:MAG: flippase-like domain-containing protein [Proteobacteria bacterium]|nr:flippase-like domain-containing protein [Pseudomonadota bacterium]
MTDAPQRARSRVAVRAIQVLVTLAAFAWLAGKVELSALVEALRSISPTAVVLAALAYLLGAGVGALRWTWRLRAYGAASMPAFSWIARIYLIGMFYNLWAPGGIGGDVVRGVAVRRAFQGTPGVAATQGLAVTLVERLCGLIGLMILVSVGMTLWPVEGLESMRPAAIAVLASALCVVAGIALSRRVAPYTPRVIGDRLAALPPLTQPGLFFAAIAASLGTQFLTALTGFFLLQALVREATLTDAIVLVPVSMATAFLPISVGGAGVREATFAALYSLVGVATDAALAASLALFAVQLAVSALGGLLTLVPDAESSVD